MGGRLGALLAPSVLRSHGRVGDGDAMSAKSAASPGSSTCLVRSRMAGPNRSRRPVLGLQQQGKQYRVSFVLYIVKEKVNGHRNCIHTDLGAQHGPEQ